MSTIDHAKVERARAKVRESKLDPLTTEHMEAALDLSAEATNGVPDKIPVLADAVHALCLALAHFVSSHAANCPFRNGTAYAPAERIRQVISAVRPALWPGVAVVALICAFGGGPALLNALSKLTS